MSISSVSSNQSVYMSFKEIAEKPQMLDDYLCKELPSIEFWLPMFETHTGPNCEYYDMIPTPDNSPMMRPRSCLVDKSQKPNKVTVGFNSPQVTFSEYDVVTTIDPVVIDQTTPTTPRHNLAKRLTQFFKK